jgi:drug/metabolite transporter (DMT)-like permease
MQKSESRALAALAFTVVVWGITPVFIRSISLLFGPTQALIIRLLLTGAVFAVVLAVTTGFQMQRKDLLKLLALSLVGMLGYYTFTVFGFAYAPAGIGTLIVSTQPLIMAVLATLAGTDRMTPTTILGLVISFAGSAFLVWGDNLGSGVAQSNLAFGCTLIFLSGLCWSIFVIFSKPLIQRYGSLKITGLSNILIMFPALPFVSGETVSALTGMSVSDSFSLAFLILIGATTAVFTWNYAAGLLRPSLLGSSLYVLPVVALIAGWAILNETVTIHTLFAAVVILAGVAISQYKPKARQTA